MVLLGNRIRNRVQETWKHGPLLQNYTPIKCQTGWTGRNCDACAHGWTGEDCDTCADGFLPPTCDQVCDGFGCCNHSNCQGCIQNGQWYGHWCRSDLPLIHLKDQNAPIWYQVCTKINILNQELPSTTITYCTNTYFSITWVFPYTKLAMLTVLYCLNLKNMKGIEIYF